MLEQILACLPDADLFAVTSRPDAAGLERLGSRRIHTSMIQDLPLGSRWPQAYLPFLPLAIEQLDLRSYDLVISNSHCVAKGVITSPSTCHLAYVHTPARYAWDLQDEYSSRVPAALRPFWLWQMHRFRMWDTISAQRPDAIACNSTYIARRIMRAWRRESEVVFPPVDTTAFVPGTTRDNYYVTASRMVGYKHVPLIAKAFSRMPSRQLCIIGDGPELNQVKAIAATTKNIKVLGFLPKAQLVLQVQRAKAFVFAAEEDFGIAPVEAMACGIPVIAFGRGGSAESVIDGVTGWHFQDQTVESIVNSIELFEASAAIDPSACRRRGLDFSSESFRQHFMSFVGRHYSLPIPAAHRSVGDTLQDN